MCRSSVCAAIEESALKIRCVTTRIRGKRVTLDELHELDGLDGFQLQCACHAVLDDLYASERRSICRQNALPSAYEGLWHADRPSGKSRPPAIAGRGLHAAARSEMLPRGRKDPDARAMAAPPSMRNDRSYG
jgi:hypothetical protein